MITPRCLEQIGNKLSSDGCSRVIFFILSGIWIIWYDCSDSSSRSSPTGSDKYEELHEVVVYTLYSCLDDKDILVTNGLA